MNKYLEKIAEMQEVERGNHFWRNAAIGGATLGAAVGGTLLARKGLHKLRTLKARQSPTPENFSDLSPAHKQFHEDMENYRKDFLNYHIFSQGNAQKVPWEVEKTLKSKYPLELTHPAYHKSFANSSSDDAKRQIFMDYIRHNKIPTKLPEKDWGYSILYPDIHTHLSNTERDKARDIVAQHLKDHIGG